MKNTLLVLSGYISAFLLLFYSIVSVFGVYLLFTGTGIENFTWINYASSTDSFVSPPILMIVNGVLMTVIMFLLIRILWTIDRSSPFSTRIIQFLKWTKTCLFAIIIFEVFLFVFKLIQTGSFRINVDEKFLLILLLLIFIDIYQQSIRIHQEHQLTI